MNALEKIKYHLREAERIGEEELGANNIFYNEGFIEAFMADNLNHVWNTDTQGGDAFEDDGTPTEYKAINTRSKSKGSFQFHWLSDNKMEKLHRTNNMYFARRAGVMVDEIYKVGTPRLIDKISEKATKSKSTNGHVGFSFKQILNLDPTQVYASNHSA